MFSDIVIPKNNESEFIETASRLGLKKIYFLYDFEYYNKEKVQQKLGLIRNNKNVETEIGFIANNRIINNASKISRLIVVKSCDKDRFFIESGKIKLIYGFEEQYTKDYLHQRASGLNHVICELAKKNNLIIGFSYSSLFDNIHATSLLMGRMMQNINLCKKYKVKTIIGSFSGKPFDLRSPYDLKSLFTMLGMDGKTINDSLIKNFIN